MGEKNDKTRAEPSPVNNPEPPDEDDLFSLSEEELFLAKRAYIQAKIAEQDAAAKVREVHDTSTKLPNDVTQPGQQMLFTRKRRSDSEFAPISSARKYALQKKAADAGPPPITTQEPVKAADAGPTPITTREPCITTRRKILAFLVAITASSITINRGYHYFNLYEISQEILALKKDLEAIAGEFNGITYLAIAKNPAYYTDLLIKGTDTIDRIIALIDMISSEEECIDDDYFLEAKVHAAKTINSFQSGNVQFLLNRARSIIKTRSKLAKVAAVTEKYAGGARRRIADLIGYERTTDAINLGKEIIGEATDRLPALKEAKDLAQDAGRIAKTVVSLADFLLAAEALTAKLRELMISFKKIECKEGEQMDPFVESMMDNPIAEKRKKAIEAFGLMPKLNTRDASAEEINKIQSFLHEYGYLRSGSHNKNPGSGEYDTSTHQARIRLYTVLKNNLNFGLQFCEKPPSDTTPVTRNNPVVKNLQSMLQSLGYLGYDQKIDGDYGSATHNAYEQFTTDTINRQICVGL